MRHFLVLLPAFIFASARVWASGDATTNTTITFVNRPLTPVVPAKGLHYAADPAGALPAVTTALQQLSNNGTSVVSVPQLDVDLPMANFDLTNIEDILSATNSNTNLRALGHIYPVEDHGRFIAIVGFESSGRTDVTTYPLNYTYALAGGMPEIMTTLDKLATNSQVLAGSYEVRLLSFIWHGELGVTVIWLKSTAGGPDLICPYHQIINTKISPGALYTMTDFVAKISSDYQQGQDAIKAKQDAIFAENVHKTTSSEDTTSTRLKNLQTALATVQADLQQAPDSTQSFFKQTLADLIAAQTMVAQGLDCVKAHPEENALHPPVLDQVDRTHAGATGWSVRIDLELSAANSPNGAFPLGDTCKVMVSGIDDFVGDPSRGIAAVGELGGQYNLILRDVAAAENALVNEGLSYIAHVSGRPAGITRGRATNSLAAHSMPMTAPMNLSAPSGSISGRVAWADGKPVSGATVSFLAVDSLDYGMQPSGNRFYGQLKYALPGTRSDASGNFLITNVLAGFYVVAVGNSDWQVIEVRDGVDTILPAPIVYRQGGGTGG